MPAQLDKVLFLQVRLLTIQRVKSSDAAQQPGREHLWFRVRLWRRRVDSSAQAADSMCRTAATPGHVDPPSSDQGSHFLVPSHFAR